MVGLVMGLVGIGVIGVFVFLVNMEVMYEYEVVVEYF